jgi:sugar-specific transcriptional regulator TrmB
MFEKELKELGLTDNEIKIYLYLLKEGISSPSKIASSLGLHRGYTYDALNRMLEKGFVNTLTLDSKINFNANDPEIIFENFELKLNLFKTIIPNLKKLIPQKSDTNVEMHKGKRVYRTLIKDIISTIKKNDEILIIGINEDEIINEVEPIYLKQYLNLIKSKNITERIIIKKGTKKFKLKNLKYKELDHIGETAKIIYGNKVATFLKGDNYTLIITNNRDYSNSERLFFENMWKN